MSTSSRLKTSFATCVAFLALSACGGGGGDSPGPTSPGGAVPTTPVAPPVVQSVTPPEADAGAQVTITGTGLTRITAITVSGVPVTIGSQSDAQIVFTVPETATTGPVVLSGSGFSIQAPGSLRIFGLPTVATVSATNASVSGTLNLTGTNLDRASAFMVGTAPVVAMTVSPSSATLRMPATPASGPLRVQDRSGRTRDTVHMLTVWRPMSITDINPRQALPGDTITITGEGLEHVVAVGFSSGVSPVPLSYLTPPTTPETAGPLAVRVKVPSVASNGPIALFSEFESNGVLSPVNLSVLPRVSVNRMIVSASPASTPSAITGEALYNQQVPIPGGVPLSCANCHGPAHLFKLSRAAVLVDQPTILARINGVIAANTGGMGAYASWTQQQRSDVAFYINTAGSTPPSTTAVISSIALSGSNFGLVRGARIGVGTTWIAATPSNVTPTSLILTPMTPLPAGTALPVELIVEGQPNVQAGTVHVQNNGAIYLFGAEVAQVHSRQVGSNGIRLTPGRPFLLRAAVLATSSILPPAVTATVSRNGVPVGTVTMTGPGFLASSYDANDNNTMFSAVIPGAWVTPGMMVTINVATAPAMQLTFTPQIGAPARLNVVLVPVQIGTAVGVPPSSTAVQDALARTWPLARQDITVETRSAMPVNVSTPVTATQMGQINLSLHQRQMNEPSKVFYGVLPTSALPQTASLTAGLALSIPDPITPATWLMSATGWDASWTIGVIDRFGQPWIAGIETLLHELGHLHSRRHAPCGGAVGPDLNYPRPDGKHGDEPLYSSTYAGNLPGVIAAARVQANPPFTSGLTPNDRLGDLMGYCNSAWFSTYNYDYVQKFLENRTAAAQAASAQVQMRAQASNAGASTDRRFLVLSGLIGQYGVTLAPAQVLPFAPIAPHAGGPYSMAIRTVAGEVIKVDFAAPDVSHDAAKSFTVVVPDPGPVESVEVSKALRVIPLAATSARARSQSAGSGSKTKAGPAVTWSLAADHIEVRWNAEAEPYLSAALVHRDGRRELIASDLTGGAARIHTGERPVGTRVELTVGSEFGARVIAAGQ